MRGLWADERLDGNIWKLSNPLHRLFYKYFKTKEKHFVEKCDWLVSLTHNGLTELQKLYGRQVESKASVIPCCTDLELFNPLKSAPAKVEGLEPGDYTLIYTGSIGTWYYTSEMLDCVETWSELLPRLKLLVVTKDTQEINRLLSARTTNLRERVVVTSASFNEMPDYLSLARAAIFFIKPAYSKIASSPTKMAECWAMELPIITNSGIGDNDIFFRDYKAGVLVSSFTKPAYEKAFKDFFQLNPERREVRAIAERHFDRAQGLAAYLQIYRKISSGGSRSN